MSKQLSWDNIEVRINGQKVEGVVPVIYNEKAELIKQLKDNGVNLVYGIGKFPIAIEHPRGCDIIGMPKSDLIYKITREEWLNDNPK